MDPKEIAAAIQQTLARMTALDKQIASATGADKLALQNEEANLATRLSSLSALYKSVGGDDVSPEAAAGKAADVGVKTETRNKLAQDQILAQLGFQTPDEKQRDAIAQIFAASDATWQRTRAELKYRMDNGLIEPAAAEREAKLAYEKAVEELKGQIQRAGIKEQGLEQRITQEEASKQRSREAQEAFDRERPYKDAQLKQQRQATQLSALQAQGKQGQDLMTGMASAGVAPSMATVQMAMGPLQSAMQIMREMQASGSIDEDMMPVPKAPEPQALGMDSLTSSGGQAGIRGMAPRPGGY